MSCRIYFANRLSPGVARNKTVPDKEGVLSWEKYEAEYFVSTDQFLLKHLVVCHLVLVDKDLISAFMETTSSMIPLLVLFGWRTRFFLDQVKPSWESNHFRNIYGISLLYRWIIIMEIIGFLCQKCFTNTSTKGVNLKVFLVMNHSARTLIQSMQLSLSCWISNQGFHILHMQDSIKQMSKYIPWIFSRPKFPAISIHCLYRIFKLKITTLIQIYF